MAIIDLSPAVPHGFKGPPSTDIGVVLDVRVRPGYWQSAHASLSLHTGCHVESALHVIDGGEPIDAVSLDRVVGSAVVLRLDPVAARELIDADRLRAAEGRLRDAGESIAPGDIVLLCTGWSDRAIGTPEYFRRSPALTEDAARWLVEREPRAIGCDFFEEPAARDPGWKVEEFVVHRLILGAGVPLVEGIVNLGALPPRCEFFAPFFKFGGVESAPARAFARAAEEVEPGR